MRSNSIGPAVALVHHIAQRIEGGLIAGRRDVQATARGQLQAWRAEARSFSAQSLVVLFRLVDDKPICSKYWIKCKFICLISAALSPVFFVDTASHKLQDEDTDST
jgi:hypothetical protein